MGTINIAILISIRFLCSLNNISYLNLQEYYLSHPDGPSIIVLYGYDRSIIQMFPTIEPLALYSEIISLNLLANELFASVYDEEKVIDN